MIVGHFAPRPPAATGVADYAESLHRALAAQGEVRWNQSKSDIVLYHIGNNGFHREIYERALQHPGVVILHDAVLHHFLLGTLTEREYRNEFEYNFGNWSGGLAAELWRSRSRSASDPRYFDYPMIRRIAERSKAVIVHSQRAADLVRRHAPEARAIEVIPHLFEPPAETAPLLRWENRAVFGVFGHLRESKRLSSVLKAIHDVPGALLVIAGKFVSQEHERALEAEMLSKRVIVLPFADQDEFWRRARAVDVCVNLRSPSVGETSGITVRMMGIGKPVIVTADGEAKDYPPGSCASVESGPAEQEMLTVVMQWLSSSFSDRQAMGEVARRHIAQNHAPAAVASKVWKVLQTAALLFLMLMPVRAAVLRSVMMPMRDGAHLATNVFLPTERGIFPALLIRTPYGKGNSLNPQYQPFADRGYALVIQDVRGRYASQGVFQPLTQETTDGEDTLRWIARQAWSNGSIAMLGGSYVGLAQWKAASAGLPSLKAIVPVHAGLDEYTDRFYSQGGALRLGHRMLWLTENMRAAGFHPPSFSQYVRHTPLRTIDVAATGHRLDLLQKVLNHPTYDSFWREISMREKLANAALPPAFVVSGWYDPNVQSDLEWFSKIQRGSRAHRLVVGPWAHNMSIPFEGVDFGKEAHFPVRTAQLAWFDHYLKGKSELPRGGPVTIFVMGLNQWRDEQEWPLHRAIEKKLYLDRSRKLSMTPGKDADERYTYDPRDPVPTRGGNTCCNPKIFAWGPMDQRPVESRRDVLTYSTEPLIEQTEITGPIRVHLYVQSSAPDTDFTAKLLDIFPSGEARNLTDGILRLRYRDGLDKEVFSKAGKTYEITIDAGVTSNAFLPGHRIGLEISSSNFPKYDRNPNTGRAIADEMNWAAADQTIQMGKHHPSYILLPVVSSK